MTWDADVRGRQAAALLVHRAGRLAPAVVSRPLHVGLFSLVLGLLLGPRAPSAVLLVAGATLMVGAVCSLAARRCTRGDAPDFVSPGGHVHGLALAATILLLTGAALGGARAAALEHTALAGDVGHYVAGAVVVEEAPRLSGFGGWSAMVVFRGEPVLLRVGEASGALPRVGARMEVRGGLRRPGDFAAVRHAHAELRARTTVVVGARGGVAGVVDGVRLRAERALDAGLPPAAAGLLRGMVLGEDSALPDATRVAFRSAGLSHLVAASGTNVVLLAALAVAMGTAVGLGLTGRLWLVLVLIALYVPLAGGGASIQRAGVMGAAAVAAGLVGRPASRWYGLGLAAAVTLLLDPRAAGDPGWQLSFVAVLSLLVLAPRWRGALVRAGVPGALADVTSMTGAATLATAPLIAAHFGQASLAGVPANLLAAPVVAPIMWLGVTAAVLGQVTALGGPVAFVGHGLIGGLDAAAGFPLGYLAWLADTASSMPGAVLKIGPWPVLLVCVAVATGLASRRAGRAAPLAAVVCAAGWIGLAPAAAAPPGPPDGFRLTFLDVGQGDATLLQDGASSVLVDTGLPDAGVVGRLRKAGIRRLDLLVVTHADADHVGGAASVVSNLPVGLVLDGRDGVATEAGAELATDAAARQVRMVPGQMDQQLRVGGLVLRVLWPPRAPAAAHAGADPNDRAIVLDVTCSGARVLLTADAESDVLSRLDLHHVDVLKVSHHGSADPGLGTLLDRLTPRIAGIEVGAHNMYGHPAPSTLAALTHVPTVVRTDRDGTVRLDLDATGRWQLRAHA